jgi:hypothetical protein
VGRTYVVDLGALAIRNKLLKEKEATVYGYTRNIVVFEKPHLWTFLLEEIHLDEEI